MFILFGVVKGVIWWQGLYFLVSFFIFYLHLGSTVFKAASWAAQVVGLACGESVRSDFSSLFEEDPVWMETSWEHRWLGDSHLGCYNVCVILVSYFLAPWGGDAMAHFTCILSHLWEENLIFWEPLFGLELNHVFSVEWFIDKSKEVPELPSWLFYPYSSLYHPSLEKSFSRASGNALSHCSPA